MFFICKNELPVSFQILAGNTKNAQISNIQNILMAIAMSKLVNTKNVIFTISHFF